MTRTITEDWSKNSRNDTVTHVGVIVAGMLAVVLAAAIDVNESFTPASQTANQQNANARVVAAASRFKAL